MLWLFAATSAVAACDWPPDLHLNVSASLPERADYRVARVVAGWPVAPAQIASYAGPSVMTRGRPEATFRVTPAGPLPEYETAEFLLQRRVTVATAYHRARHIDGLRVFAEFKPGHHAWRDMRFVYVLARGGGGPGALTGPAAYEPQCVAPDGCRVLSHAEAESRTGMASAPPPDPSQRLHDPEWGDPPVGATEPPPLPSCVIECDLRRDNESDSRAMDAMDAADAAEVTAPDALVDVAPDAADARAPEESTYFERCARNIERCDGLDNNCDGRVDEICPCEPGATQRCYAGDPRRAGVGVCNFGEQTCLSGVEFGAWGACVGQGNPSLVPSCTGLDERCTGIIDEDCGCAAGVTRPCYTGPARTEGVGLCRPGLQTCVAVTGRPTRWGACVGETLPGVDWCDGIDRACTGHPCTCATCSALYQAPCYTGPAATQHSGRCRPGYAVCSTTPFSTCNTVGPCMGEVLPAEAEICGNGIDDDCDRFVDEDCP